jgi:5'-3' exonuclease, N-terminal resolvase-like domain
VKNLGDIEPYGVLYIDGMNLLSRSYHGMKGLEYHGRPTGMLFGLMRMFITWRHRYPSMEVVLLWEGEDSWRRKKYPIYKAQRDSSKTAEENRRFFDSLEKVKDILPVTGITQAKCPGFEADDLAFFLAKKESRKSAYSSGDWDWWGLADYGDVVYQHRDILDYSKMESMFVNKYNSDFFPVSRLNLFKVLCGDPSDNISGVPRFPRKLASALCNLSFRELPLNEYSVFYIEDALVKMNELKWAEKINANGWIIKRNAELILPGKILEASIEWESSQFNFDGMEDVLINNGMSGLFDRLSVIKE